MKIGMQEDYKKYFSVDEVNAISEMRKNNFSEINENGLELSDFTSYRKEDIIKIKLEFGKHNGVNFFSDPRLENIDILINVIMYDGYEFSDESYYYSDFIMRENSNFPKVKKSAFVTMN